MKNLDRHCLPTHEYYDRQKFSWPEPQPIRQCFLFPMEPLATGLIPDG